jgi:hypothetical protein
MVEKIQYGRLKAMLMNPDVPDSEIAPYLIAIPADSGPFDPKVEPDSSKVEMSAEAEFDIGAALRWGNDICRWRRQTRFTHLLAQGVQRPVLVSEGDSWFQFPFLIDDIIDHPNEHYLIWSLDAAGDTADNMVNRQPEYQAALEGQKTNHVAGFLFSGAGNVVIGEDLQGKRICKANLCCPP